MDHLVDLVSPHEVTERESLELNDKRVRQLPDGHLFGGGPVFLTARTIPETNRARYLETRRFTSVVRGQ